MKACAICWDRRAQAYKWLHLITLEVDGCPAGSWWLSPLHSNCKVDLFFSVWMQDPTTPSFPSFCHSAKDLQLLQRLYRLWCPPVVNGYSDLVIAHRPIWRILPLTLPKRVARAGSWCRWCGQWLLLPHCSWLLVYAFGRECYATLGLTTGWSEHPWWLFQPFCLCLTPSDQPIWHMRVLQIFDLISVVTATISVAYGFGQHTASLETQAVEKALLWTMISFIFGIISFALPKLAVAALLHRIMNPTSIQRIIMWGLVILVAVIATVNILIYVTMCNPPQALWKSSMVLRGEATCRDISILIDYATFNGGEWNSTNLPTVTDKYP